MRKLSMTAFTAMIFLFAFGLQGANAEKPVTEEFKQTFFEFPLVDCSIYGLGFWVLADATFNFKQTSFFDKDGNLLRIRFRWTAEDIVYKNSLDKSKQLIPEPLWGANRWIDVKTGEMVQTGAYTRITAPGWGPLYVGFGRLIFSGDGTLTFYAGQSSEVDGDFAKFCAYMA